jgi:ATPase family AAA domain-containing protein 1
MRPFSLWRTSTTERPVLLPLSTRPDHSSHPNGRSSDTPNNMDDFSSSPTTSSKEEVNWAVVLAELALTIGMAVLSSLLLSLLTRRLLAGFSSDASDRPGGETQIVRRLRRILQQRGISTVPPLTGRELQMAEDILDPDDLDDCTFADIGGLDAMKQELYELAIVPLVQPELFRHSKLIQPPKGVLLYGRPGTGKTMLAKALAKEAQAVFLPLQLSKILNKYWGESNKLIAATFSLANKLQPAIIFIDELDTFLKNSNGAENGAYMDSIKAEFLTLWDGVATHSHARVLVLGATNQPQLIDAAILRRLPRAFEVPLPDRAGRESILQLLVREEHVDASVGAALPELAELTVGYSGSDLKELCKAAAMVAVQEHTAEFARRRVMGERAEDGAEDRPAALRPMSREDLLVGWQKVRRTGEVAQQYGRRQQQTAGTGGLDRQSLHSLATLLRSLSQLSTDPPNEDHGIPDL